MTYAAVLVVLWVPAFAALMILGRDMPSSDVAVWAFGLLLYTLCAIVVAKAVSRRLGT